MLIKNSHKIGFTMLELSIVISIIALLVGGVFVAKEMIQAAKVRSVLTDMEQFQTAIAAFKIKYNYLPGDMPNATEYWGTAAGCAAGTAGTGTQTCIGNGNGIVELVGPTQIDPREQFLAWQHLANAELIRGTYTGVSSSYARCTVGINCPAGKMDGNQAYYFGSLEQEPAPNWWPRPDYTSAHAIFTGIQNTGGGYPGYPMLTAIEMLGLDTKADDGKPGTGYWQSLGARDYSISCQLGATTGAAIVDASMEQNDAVYNTANTGATCGVLVYVQM